MRISVIRSVAVLVLSAAAACGAHAQVARDHITIVGSSTVYPFSTVVAEQFGKTSRFRTPKVEATGSGGGLKLFCAGIGVGHPDIVNASRRIKQSEVDGCAANGVHDIVELKIGYDGIVIASSRRAEPLALDLRDIWLALARRVPAPAGGDALVDNPYRNWSDVNPTLPGRKIAVLGPPPTSGTRDAFVELAMEGGCDQFEAIRALAARDPAMHASVCHAIREDGAYIEAGENDNLIVQKLDADPTALGIFGFSFLDQNTDKVQGLPVGGVEPTFEDIASGAYPIARALYLYVKKVHVGRIPGMQEFLTEITSERAWGPEGYLADKGMIPMPDAERQRFRAVAQDLQPLSLAAE